MDKQSNFEAKMQRLEEIVEIIQTNEISLNDSISLFEEGTILIQSLNKELHQAEEKVKILLTKNGEFKEVDYDSEGME